MDVVDITTAQDMFEAVTSRASDMDIIIKAAAVADYRPAMVADNKMKKADADLSIPLARTEDILATLGANKPAGQFLCGFSMETENMLENSRKKLKKKNLDMIAANNLKVSGAGFGVDTNVITLITPDSETELPLMSKDAAADALLDEIQKRLHR
jgi:phosphopantothenoylcysteine decarboxylase/phosphopantothenate--cysteine ligase